MLVGIPSKGVLIGMEGIDAAGKRTQTSLLATWFQSRQMSTKTISFPDYSTVIGGEIRGYLSGNRPYSPEVGHMLYAANRWENKRNVEELLGRFQVVVVNRYTASNLAYGMAAGLRLDWLMNLEEGLPRPDLVIVLDAPPQALYSRRAKKKDVYESDMRLQESARRNYIDLAARFGWSVVDAAKSVEHTQELVRESVSKLLAARPGVP